MGQHEKPANRSSGSAMSEPDGQDGPRTGWAALGLPTVDEATRAFEEEHRDGDPMIWRVLTDQGPVCVRTGRWAAPDPMAEWQREQRAEAERGRQERRRDRNETIAAFVVGLPILFGIFLLLDWFFDWLR